MSKNIGAERAVSHRHDTDSVRTPDDDSQVFRQSGILSPTPARGSCEPVDGVHAGGSRSLGVCRSSTAWLAGFSLGGLTVSNEPLGRLASPEAERPMLSLGAKQEQRKGSGWSPRTTAGTEKEQ